MGGLGRAGGILRRVERIAVETGGIAATGGKTRGEAHNDCRAADASGQLWRGHATQLYPTHGLPTDTHTHNLSDQ
jgi:hypothetical protein